MDKVPKKGTLCGMENMVNMQQQQKKKFEYSS